MSFLVFVFLYGALAFLITGIFVRVRLSLSYFPFNILRITGYRLSFLLWPAYIVTLISNPGRFHEGFQCAVFWLVFGTALVRTVLPPMSSLYEVSMHFAIGNIVMCAVSYLSCVVLEAIFRS